MLKGQAEERAWITLPNLVCSFGEPLTLDDSTYGHGFVCAGQPSATTECFT